MNEPNECLDSSDGETEGADNSRSRDECRIYVYGIIFKRQDGPDGKRRKIKKGQELTMSAMAKFENRPLQRGNQTTLIYCLKLSLLFGFFFFPSYSFFSCSSVEALLPLPPISAANGLESAFQGRARSPSGASPQT